MTRPYLFLILIIVAANTSCTFLKHENDPFKPQMVKVMGGDYELGDFFDGTNTDAIPVHTVSIEDFLIGKYEISYAQFDHFTSITGRDSVRSASEERGNRAVVYVTWDEALAFCNYYGYRLPSEIEWEYAARSRGKNNLYSGTNSPDSIGFYAITELLDFRQTIAVGTTQPNELGIYDMSGNAFEWVGDFYQFYSMPDRFHTQETDDIRLIRGGSYTEKIRTTRTYWRTGTLRDVAAEDIGFRCAADR